MRQRHCGQMPAGRPSGDHDPVALTAQPRQLSGERIDSSEDFGHDLVERRIRRQRVADQRDIDALRHRAFRKQRKDFLGPMLPIATMDEQQRRRVVPRLEKIDAIALARSVSEIEMIRIASAQFRGTLLPAGNDVGASSHGKAIVEPEVKLLLAHCAPVRRLKRRGHAQFSYRAALQRVSTLPENVLHDYSNGKRQRRKKWRLIKRWSERPHAPSWTNSIQAKSRHLICSTCSKGVSPKSTAK